MSLREKREIYEYRTEEENGILADILISPLIINYASFIIAANREEQVDRRKPTEKRPVAAEE